MNIAFIYNLRHKMLSREDDEEAEFDTPQTIQSIYRALRAYGHKVYLIEADLDALEKLKKLKPKIDMAFNLAEGLRGEARESFIPLLLEHLEIPYSGSGPLSLGLTLDKARTKEILLNHHLPTPRFQLFKTGKEKLSRKLHFPLFVKPNAEGSSKGIGDDSVVKDRKSLYKKIKDLLKKYHQPVLVEEFLSGREFYVAIWGNGKEAETLPLGSVNFRDMAPLSKYVDSFETKHFWPSEVVLPVRRPRISKALEQKIKKMSLKTFRVLNCRDFARLDVRMDRAGHPHILDINALPSLGPAATDGFSEAAELAGYSYKEMVNKIVEVAAKRLGLGKK